MKYLIVLLTLLISSCSTEEDVEVFDVFFQNDTDQNLEIRLYDGVDSLDFSNQTGLLIIAPDERTKVCDYVFADFVGMACENIGQVVFEFPNGDGHFCYGGGSNGRCFDNNDRYFLRRATAFEQDGNEYTFHITQDDYENAYELP